MIYRINIVKSDSELKMKWIKKSSTSGVLMNKVYDLNAHGYVELYSRKNGDFKLGIYTTTTYLFNDDFGEPTRKFYATLKKFYREYLIDKLIYDV